MIQTIHECMTSKWKVFDRFTQSVMHSVKSFPYMTLWGERNVNIHDVPVLKKNSFSHSCELFCFNKYLLFTKCLQSNKNILFIKYYSNISSFLFRYKSNNKPHGTNLKQNNRKTFTKVNSRTNSCNSLRSIKLSVN